MADERSCCVCGSIVERKQVKTVEIKGKAKDICQECATAITGLV
jgi:hypothetical protein